jgi:hypothetical protein
MEGKALNPCHIWEEAEMEGESAWSVPYLGGGLGN